MIRHDEDLDYWLNTYEEESWKDVKVSSNDMLFPSHDNKCGEVVVTYLKEKR